MFHVRPTRTWRIQYAGSTAILFAVGFVLYSALALAARGQGIGGQDFPWPLVGLMGGYMLFLFLSGILLAVRWIGPMSTKKKLLLALFFPVPMVFVLLAAYYSIPYGIYNAIQLLRRPALPEEGREP